MRQLFNLWMSEWNRYGIDPWVLAIAVVIVAMLAYRDRYKTLLGVWAVVYLWTMFTVLVPGKVDLEEGFLVVWVCGYGLVGFFFLGFLFYQNLK